MATKILAETENILNESVIRRYLSENDRREMHLFDTIDSTNSFAKKLADEGKPHGTLVAADMQTNGRGRLGRSFCSPSGGNIYMSVIIRQDISIETSQLITSCIAVAVAKAVDKICKTKCDIKWVNDLFLNGKKICGILTESSVRFENRTLDYAVVGIGINLKSIKNSFPSELLETATSVEDETGKIPSRCRLIAEILKNIDAYIADMHNRKFMEEYRNRSFITGMDIEVVKYNSIRIAKAVGIDENAGLIVEYDNGEREVLNSGEARILKYNH